MIERNMHKLSAYHSVFDNPENRPLSSTQSPIYFPYISEPLRCDQKVNILSILRNLSKNLIRSKIFLWHQAKISDK